MKCGSKESGDAVRAGRLPTGQRPSHKPAQGNALGERMTNDPALKGRDGPAIEGLSRMALS